MNRQAGQGGTQRGLHVEEQVEPPMPQQPNQVEQSPPTLTFVVDDELDSRDVPDESQFGFADNPGDFGLRPVVLQGAQGGQDMADIADGRQSQKTELCRWM